MSERSLKIILVSPVPPPYGGIGHWTAMVGKYAENRSDVQISIINTAPRWRSIHDLSVWKRAIGGGLQFVRDILLLSWLLSTCCFDAIHLTTSGQLAVIRDLGVLFIAGLFRVPVIYHIRFGRVPQIAMVKSCEWRLMAWVMQQADTVVAIDRTTRDAIKEYLPAVNVELIPNCINLAELPSLNVSDQPVRTVLFIGWVIPTKGLSELLEAWSHLKPKGWHLKIVGPGDIAYRQELIDRYRPECVEFLGELPHEEAMKLMSLCDLFVLPSYTEGFPNVILEAMSLGKAIVATNVGAIPEMLADGCGVLIKPRDVEGLATALRRLITDEQQWAIMGERARTRALATFSLESVFATYMSVWRQAAGLPEQETSGEVNQ